MSDTNRTVRLIGRQPYKRIPFAHMVDVEAGEQLAQERDLRDAPTPISGGMRKALAKERGFQDALRYRPPRRYRIPDLQRAYGLFEVVCGFCRHAMYFDEVEDFEAIRCDRCGRPIW